jgi:chorismate mutase
MRQELQRRIAELSHEIRHYPTPIARCDLHLPALIEERARLMDELAALGEHGSCSAEALWANDGGFNAA